MRALLVAFVLLALAGEASAGKVFRWTDSKGQVHFSDKPDAGVTDLKEVNVKLGTATEAVKPADPAELEEQRVADCKAKREQLVTYEKSVRLVEKSALGTEREFTGDEKSQLIAKTRSEIEQLCVDIPLPETPG